VSQSRHLESCEGMEETAKEASPSPQGNIKNN
jgi:hypothetical protein